MIIQNIIVHELKKEATQTHASIDFSDKVMTKDSKSEDLVKELNDRYNNLRITYGIFDESNNELFPREYKKYRKNSNEENFVFFSKIVMENLKQKIESIAPAKGGYILFAEYKTQDEFVGIFLIRNKMGKLFTKDNSEKVFRIETPEHIDLEKMAMACRINKNMFDGTIGRYLSFIKKSNEEMSEYFMRWIAVANREDNKQDTIYLKDIACDIDPPIIPETGEYMSTSDFLNELYSFIYHSPNKQVDIKEIGLHFYGDENIILNYANRNNIPINTNFRSDPIVLKRFVNVKVKSDDIELSFPHMLFNDRIRVENDQILIKSQRLAQQILSEVS